MYTPLTRLVLGSVMLVLAVLEAAEGRWWLVAPCLLAIGLLVLGFFRHGTVWLACRAAKRGRLDRARALLAKTRWPDRLSSSQRPYYEWMRAILCLEETGGDGDLTVAEAHLRRARDGRLRTDNDRCLVTAMLAEVVFLRGDAVRARALLTEAREFPHSPAADRILAEVESKVAGRGGSGPDRGSTAAPTQ